MTYCRWEDFKGTGSDKDLNDIFPTVQFCSHADYFKIISKILFAAEYFTIDYYLLVCPCIALAISI